MNPVFQPLLLGVEVTLQTGHQQQTYQRGGFTAALVCIFLLPKLEKYCQLKAPTRRRKSEDGHYDGKFAGPNPVHMGPIHGVVHDAEELVHHAGELVHHAGDIMHHAGEIFHHTVDHKHHDEDKDHTKTK